jgi:TM2 domain-containing membrane protein YozV
MSDQNPEVPGLPDPAEVTEAAPEAAAAVESAPEAVTEVVEAAPTLADPAGAVPPPAFDAGAVPPPPPPGYAPAGAMVPVFPNGKPMLDAAGQPVSDKSRLAAALLCFFLGGLGIHRFYVGKIGTGIAIILTFGGFFGIWPLIDLIMILIGSFKDKSEKALQNW